METGTMQGFRRMGAKIPVPHSCYDWAEGALNRSPVDIGNSLGLG